jgi:hypothetical protein
MAVVSTLTYYKTATITGVKSFIVLAVGRVKQNLWMFLLMGPLGITNSARTSCYISLCVYTNKLACLSLSDISEKLM